MSNEEQSKTKMRPEILVTLVVAIIALFGTLGAALISNMDKIWPKPNSPDSPSVSSSTVASSPQLPPSPAPRSPAPLDITGKWRDNFGNTTDIIQHGDAVTATGEGMACRGPYNSTLSGTIIGNTLESTYQSSYSIGRCRGTISADGMRITSSCSDSVCGPFEASSVRVE